VNVSGETRAQVMQLVEVYRAKIIDISPESLVIEATGNEGKIESFLEVLMPYGISELVRTGIVAMARGTRSSAQRATSVAAEVQDNLGNYSV
jgi:acetolactate synthase I/III small subunit